MTDESTILSHYNLTAPYPFEWPVEKDQDDAPDGDLGAESNSQATSGIRRSKSRYSALERVGSNASSVLRNSERTGDGVENLVQRDEPDPLGSSESVVRILRRRGLPVEEDAKLRNRFLLSSTTFSPALFLSQVHSSASTQSLFQGLDFLSRSIDQKSASLKVLVESNFERFVRAKATIDNVYTEMRNQGATPGQDALRSHSRHTSRTSNHMRKISGTEMPLSPPSPSGVDKKKNALTKESEYGVRGIKTPLIEVSIKAEEVWGPALGGREREESLKAILQSVDQYRGVFEAGATIADCIKRKDYDALIEAYGRARRYADEAKATANSAVQSKTALTPTQIHQILIAARMWADVEEQIEAFKRVIWGRLAGVPSSSPLKGTGVDGTRSEDPMELIGILLELGTQDNPIWVWLLTRYQFLKNEISSSFEHFMMEIEVLRRHMSIDTKPSPQAVASHLRYHAHQGQHENAGTIDTNNVVELWERMLSLLNSLIGPKGSVLSEVIEFWETAQSFIEERAQRTLPIGFDGQSRVHHRLSKDGVKELQKGAVELVNTLRDGIYTFFADPPIEDVSTLFSPIPGTPGTPLTPRSTMLSPRVDSRFNFDPNSLPPPSPKRGESWEKYAFWPPHANSLSAVLYLSRILALVGSAASDMAAMSAVAEVSSTLERIRTLVSTVRERCIQAICAAWIRDAEDCKVLEDWTRTVEKRDLTRMPAHFLAFEGNVLSGMQKILYVSDAKAKPGSVDVILPPPAKLLQQVRSQFVASLYRALSGMVENAERTVKPSPGQSATASNSIASPVTSISPMNMTAHTVNANDRNVRVLLTLSNLQEVRTNVVPLLTSQFENAFSVKLTDESKTIRDVLGQIEARLFQTYTRPHVENLSGIIKDGILSPTWAPVGGRPSEVRPYIYTTLLALVLVHTQVSTTVESLTPQILSYLLEQVSLALLQSFKKRSKYTLAALMQATLDVEFMAQTLHQYTTDKASEVQSQIYLELDRGTDNDARMKLQSELPEMRSILKTLRESTKVEFACFKKIRSQRERVERPPQ